MKKMWILLFLSLFCINFISANGVYELIVVADQTYIEPGEEIVFHVRLVGQSEISEYSYLNIFSEKDTSFREIVLCTGEKCGAPTPFEEGAEGMIARIGGNIIRDFANNTLGTHYKLIMDSREEIRVGDHIVSFAFKYKDEGRWYVTKTEKSFHVQTRYERNEWWFNWVALIGIILVGVYSLADSKTLKRHCQKIISLFQKD